MSLGASCERVSASAPARTGLERYSLLPDSIAIRNIHSRLCIALSVFTYRGLWSYLRESVKTTDRTTNTRNGLGG